MKLRFAVLLVITTVAAHLSASASTKPVLERGWIGGEYSGLEKTLAPSARRGAVFVKQVYAGTPAARAGLQRADLIVAVDGHAIRNLRAFHHRIGAAAPGSRATVRVLRGGDTLEIPVTVGRERYQNWHSLSFGFRLSSRLDLLPNPGFSLLPLAEFQRNHEHAELRAPEQTLARQFAKPENASESGVRSDEGWNAWFVILGLNGHKRILSQEAP